jgi:hypothetical protein
LLADTKGARSFRSRETLGNFLPFRLLISSSDWVICEAGTWAEEGEMKPLSRAMLGAPKQKKRKRGGGFRFNAWKRSRLRGRRQREKEDP